MVRTQLLGTEVRPISTDHRRLSASSDPVGDRTDRLGRAPDYQLALWLHPAPVNVGRGPSHTRFA